MRRFCCYINGQGNIYYFVFMYFYELVYETTYLFMMLVDI